MSRKGPTSVSPQTHPQVQQPVGSGLLYPYCSREIGTFILCQKSSPGNMAPEVERYSPNHVGSQSVGKSLEIGTTGTTGSIRSSCLSLDQCVSYLGSLYHGLGWRSSHSHPSACMPNYTPNKITLLTYLNINFFTKLYEYKIYRWKHMHAVEFRNI